MADYQASAKPRTTYNIGCIEGGQSGDAHRLSEWYDPTGREQGYKRALLLALSMTGLA